METALKTAYNALPMLSREELRQLQQKIADMLRENGDATSPFHPLTEAEWAAELDAAIAEFDAGKGYSAEEMSRSIRQRFGWADR